MVTWEAGGGEARCATLLLLLIAGAATVGLPLQLWSLLLLPLHLLTAAVTLLTCAVAPAAATALFPSQEALEMMRKGVAEVRSRLVVSPPKFLVKVIDKDGIRTLGEL